MTQNVASGVLLSLLCLVACGRDGCTEIGCFDGLELRMTPPLAGSEELTVQVEGDLSIECTQPALAASGRCKDAGLVFEVDSRSRVSAIKLYAVHPASISVRVLADGTLAREGTQTGLYYGEVQPNGPDCEPRCRAAQLEVKEP